MKRKTFCIQRIVTSGTGISAYIELPATDAADAERQADALFSHEEATATYQVKQKRGGK